MRHLRYLLAVAEHNNFTLAAKDLHVPSPPCPADQTAGNAPSGRNCWTAPGGLYVSPKPARRTSTTPLRLRDLAAAERAVLDVADPSRGHLRLPLTQTSTAYLLGPLPRNSTPPPRITWMSRR